MTPLELVPNDCQTIEFYVVNSKLKGIWMWSWPNILRCQGTCLSHLRSESSSPQRREVTGVSKNLYNGHVNVGGMCRACSTNGGNEECLKNIR